MPVSASGQITLIDLTDGYSVVLTNDNHTFLGDTDSVSATQTTTCMVQALCGSKVVACAVGAISTPAGLSIVSDGETPTPTLTITATSALTQSGSVTIPVQIGEITINKSFSWSIAFRGTDGESVSITGQEVRYQASSSGTTPPSGTWAEDVPAASAGQYLWTRTTVNYSDGTSTVAYSVSRNGTNGSNGTSVSIASQEVRYQVGSSGTSAPTGTWSATVPSTSAGQYLWTRTVVTYSDGTSTTSYSVARNGTNGTNGADGADGADALSMVIISSNGSIFKNTEIATTLTAHVYRGGAEVTGSALTALGTIRWYKDGGTTAVATGQTLTISAGDVANSANYTAQLEA